MELAEIHGALHRALPLRVPHWSEQPGGAAKVAALEDYMLLAANHRGELEEALYWAHAAGRRVKDEWDRIEGYEVALGRGDRTEARVNEAKRTIRPELWDALQEAKRLVEDLGRQIRRLEIDDRTVSRAYTLITGSA